MCLSPSSYDHETASSQQFRWRWQKRDRARARARSWNSYSGWVATGATEARQLGGAGGFLAVVILAGSLLAGCSSSGPSSAAYVHSSSSEVELMTWVDHDGQLNGTFDGTSVVADDGWSISAGTSCSLSGDASSSTVTIRLAGCPDAGSYSATTSGNALDLQLPDLSAGGLSTETFRRGSATGYDAAVRGLTTVDLQVFLDAGATSAEVASVRATMAETPQILRCSYLDHAESYAQAERIMAGSPTAIAALTPATTPTVFRCETRDLNSAAIIARTFNSGVPGVYQATSPSPSLFNMLKMAASARSMP